MDWLQLLFASSPAVILAVASLITAINAGGQVSELKGRIDERDKEIDRLEARIREREERIAKLEIRIETLEGQNTTLRNDNAKLNAQVQLQQAEICTLRDQYETVVAVNEQLKMELDKYRGKQGRG
jgi:chromosome segregation ATPase